MQRSNTNVKWQRPKLGFVKISTNVNLSEVGIWGLDVVARDDNGEELGSSTWCVEGFEDRATAEAFLMFKALCWAIVVVSLRSFLRVIVM